MGKAELLAVTLLSLLAVGLYNYQQTPTINTQGIFESWMDLHGKHYDTHEQRKYRHSVWTKNFEFVQEHNAKFMLGDETFEVEMNHFADLSTEEFASKYTMPNADFTKKDKCTGAAPPSTNLPDSVDWTTKGAVTGVKNQGQCGSCWAFSATGSLEGAYNIVTKQSASFSEQQLVDCSTSYGNHGCNGGLMDFAFYYVHDQGITLESSYPYKGKGGSCQKKPAAWNISDCYDVPEEKVASLRASVAQQPVSVAIQANQVSFQLYKKGILSGNCGKKLDHGVLAVGYGSESGKKFWKVKNSWGGAWGESGYVRIEDDGKDGAGKCGILMAASFPIA